MGAKKLVDILIHALLPLMTVGLAAATVCMGTISRRHPLLWLVTVTFAVLAIVHGYVTWQLYTRKEEVEQ